MLTRLTCRRESQAGASFVRSIDVPAGLSDGAVAMADPLDDELGR
jgi:hypothetical protein